jgi:hypothetical protein
VKVHCENYQLRLPHTRAIAVAGAMAVAVTVTIKAPTHQSDRGGGAGRDGGSNQFEKSRKHNIAKDASIISYGRRSVTFGSGS